MVNLLYDLIKEEEKMLIKAAERLGVKMELVRVGEVVSFDEWGPGLYLVRTLSHNRAIISASIIEGNGGVAVNSSQAIALCWNKAAALAKLKSAGLPVPRSWALFGPAKIDVREKLIVKSVSGSWGRKVSLVASSEELELVARTAEGEVLLLQQMVGTGEDVRVFVVGDRAVAAMRRIPPAGDWRSNAARGGKTLPQAIDPQLEDLAVRAAKAVGAFYAGVDILIGDGYYVNEVNGIPEFKALAKTTGIDVAEHLLREVVRLEKG
ncbi:MAG: RimK family alpha-L-glutamate ligase [Pyrobaculum sp.]